LDRRPPPGAAPPAPATGLPVLTREALRCPETVRALIAPHLRTRPDRSAA
jgi:hypothetical protein